MRGPYLLSILICLATATSPALAVKGGTSLAPDREQSCVEKEMLKRTIRIKTTAGTCSGVLLDSGRVVTAAHCFRLPVAKSPLSLPGHLAGIMEIQRFDPTTNSYVTVPGRSQMAYKLGNNLKWTFAEDADLALVSLDTPVEGISAIRSAVPSSSGHHAGERVLKVGFGRTENNDYPLHPKYLELVRSRKIQSTTRTSASGLEIRTIPAPEQLRRATPAKVGERGADGDSGGPIFRVRGECQLELLGVTSGGDLFNPANLHPLDEAIKFGRIAEAAFVAEQERKKIQYAESGSKPDKGERPKVSAIPVRLAPVAGRD